MKTNNFIFLSFLSLSFSVSTTLNGQIRTDCKKLNSQAVDSLSSYKSNFNKKTSTLEFALNLLDEAIGCDSNLYVAKFNKVTVLNELGQFHQAINLIDKLIVLKQDSSLLLIKGPIYEKINETDSVVITYKLAHHYFERRLKDAPKDSNFIFGKIFSQSKISGKESVRSEIDYYLKKYPDDMNLKALLRQVF